MCCRSNCNGLLSCHSLFYFDSLFSPRAVCSFTTFPCFPPCLCPPHDFHLCLVVGPSLIALTCVPLPSCMRSPHLLSFASGRHMSLFRNLVRCASSIVLCQTRFHLIFFFFINQEDTVSWPLLRKKSPFCCNLECVCNIGSQHLIPNNDSNSQSCFSFLPGVLRFDLPLFLEMKTLLS